MLVRIENIRGTNDWLVIDEIDRYLGYCELQIFFDCTDIDSDVTIIDEFEYYTVDKAELLKNLFQ